MATDTQVKMPEKLIADPQGDGSVGTLVTEDGEVFAQAHAMIADAPLPANVRVRARRERAANLAHRYNAYEAMKKALEVQVAAFEARDAKTEWTVSEPEWWLDWSAAARKAREALSLIDIDPKE